jgi:hypothetical protein
MGKLGNETITVLKASLVVDSRTRSEYRDWDNAVLSDYGDCSLQPARTSEGSGSGVAPDRELILYDVRLIGPPTLVVGKDDRIQWRGTTYEVFGEPERWYHRGKLRHVALNLKRRDG